MDCDDAIVVEALAEPNLTIVKLSICNDLQVCRTRRVLETRLTLYALFIRGISPHHCWLEQEGRLDC